MDSPSMAALLGLLAVTPALLQLWWGRRLAQQSEDAALAEQLLAFRNRRRQVVGAAAGVLLWHAHSVFWPWLVLLVTSVAAAYPLRRALYGETWNVAGYLWFAVRLIVAVWG